MNQTQLSAVTLPMLQSLKNKMLEEMKNIVIDLSLTQLVKIKKKNFLFVF